MKYLLPLLFVSTFLCAQQPSTDSTQALFKNVQYSYSQMDFGYTGMQIGAEFLQGIDMSMIGAVFNKHWYTALGFAFSFNKGTGIYLTTQPPDVENFISMHWHNELLFQPEKLVNFSIPLRISRVGATTWDTFPPTTTQMISNWNFSGVDYYQHSGGMWTASAGANVFLNVFKSLSLGVGGHYRFAFGASSVLGSEEKFKGYSINVFLRWKWNVREHMKKMMERQKEYLKKMQ